MIYAITLNKPKYYLADVKYSQTAPQTSWLRET